MSDEVTPKLILMGHGRTRILRPGPHNPDACNSDDPARDGLCSACEWDYLMGCLLHMADLGIFVEIPAREGCGHEPR